MKKAYSKPQILFDSFELSQAVAAGCVYEQNQAEYQCPVDIGKGRTIFSQTGVCVWTPPNPDDVVCYHAPADNNNIFTS